MNGGLWAVRPLIVIVFAVAGSVPVLAAHGRVLVPALTGRPETQVFKGFTGWIDAYGRGYGRGTAARIRADGTFQLDTAKQPACLIAMFDRMETPPIIVGSWPTASLGRDILIPAEYACVPAGYPEQWEPMMVRATFFSQTFVPRCTQIYGLSVFDGPPICEKGDQIHVFVHENNPDTKPLLIKQEHSPDPGMDGPWDMLTGGFVQRGLCRVGWRHGEMPVTPGQPYAVRFRGTQDKVKGKGTVQYETNAYIRPDGGSGYSDGTAYARGGKPVDGDLCCLIFGNGHGQLVENQIRGEEWEVFLPAIRPGRDFGQTFLSHGVSMAGVSFWASSGGEKDVECEVQIFTEGPWGKKLGPAKVAQGHDTRYRPFIRYPDIPAPLVGHERFYLLPCKLFQVAWFPDEIGLEPGQTYYISIRSSRPLMMYADGDYYQDGYAFYDGLKVDRQAAGVATFHSRRWTHTINIVTYARAGGEPLESRPASPQ